MSAFDLWFWRPIGELLGEIALALAIMAVFFIVYLSVAFCGFAKTRFSEKKQKKKKDRWVFLYRRRLAQRWHWWGARFFFWRVPYFWPEFILCYPPPHPIPLDDDPVDNADDEMMEWTNYGD